MSNQLDSLEDLIALETPPPHLDTSEDLPFLALVLHPLSALVLLHPLLALATRLYCTTEPGTFTTSSQFNIPSNYINVSSKDVRTLILT